ncbi:MAG: DUF423 domain-containing protein [Ignavibacteriae bacterium]|nr:DUF423 domain-containing protein [Ignavibacteria bacterium]MBI3364893.1 DUF423 domain-containing protein [Ignavibacteriota bacterium]
MTSTRLVVVLAALSAFIAVVLGAFAAHALKEKLSPDLFNAWEVGVRYHMYHALGLFAVAWAIAQFPNSPVSVAGWLFIVGTILFSGSLYALSLSGIRWLGAITPVGGVCFLAGWLWLAWSVWRSP